MRTDAHNSPKADSKAVIRAVGKLAATLALVGLGMLASHTLGWLLIGGGAIVGWFYLNQMKWCTSRVPRRIRYLAYVILPAVSLALAFFVPREESNAPTDANHATATSSSVTTTVQGSPGTNVVTSQGQTGGITTQTYNDNRIIQYFINQPSDEREKWRQYLTEKYPLGWVLLAADGNTVYTPVGFSYKDYFRVEWGDESVAELTATQVIIRAPNIYVRDHGPLVGGNLFDVGREVGSAERFLWIGETAAVAEVLSDQGSFVVIAIGFRLEVRE